MQLTSCLGIPVLYVHRGARPAAGARQRGWGKSLHERGPLLDRCESAIRSRGAPDRAPMRSSTHRRPTPGGRHAGTSTTDMRVHPRRAASRMVGRTVSALLAMDALIIMLPGASAQCTCPDGSAPTFSGPCSGGPPTGPDCPPPPPGGGGGGGDGGTPPPPGSTAQPACDSPPCAASLLGDVGSTTVTGTDARTGKSFPIGENVYGPFEAGFGTQQNFILEALGCADGNDGHVIGGIDTATAEQMVAHQCQVTLPRVVGNDYVSLLDECGGHTNEYHFHERMSCLYDATTTGHSVRIGVGADEKGLYGKWESQPTDPSDLSTGTLPELDACGAHFGVTPDSAGTAVYHYHVQDHPPFTFGCFGPAADGGLMSVAECRGLYDGCGDGDVVQITTPVGTLAYDPWCPCWDEHGSNVEPALGEPAPAPTPTPSPVEPAAAPTPTPTPPVEPETETGSDLEPTEAELELNDAGVNGTKTSAAVAIGARHLWVAVLSFAAVWFW